MGIEISCPDREVEEAFRTLKRNFDRHKIVIQNRKPEEDMLAEVKRFFELYDRASSGGKMVNTQEDCENIFEHILNTLTGLNNYFEKSNADEIKRTKNVFKNDYIALCMLLETFAKKLQSCVKAFMGRTKICTLTNFSVTVGCFTNAFSVEKRNNPPYYLIKCKPVLNALDRIMETKSRYLALVSPHNSGKTTSYPIMIAMKSLHEDLENPYCMVVESDPVVVHSLCERITEDTYECIEIVTTGETMLDGFRARQRNWKANQTMLMGIMSHFEALKFIVKLSDDESKTFFSRCRFIIDDVHKRAVGTDIIIAQLKKRIGSAGIGAQMTCMSPTSVYLGSGVEEIRQDGMNNFEVRVETVEEKSTVEVTRRRVYIETKKVLNNCASRRIVDSSESILVYIPGDKLCRRFSKKILDLFDGRKMTTRRQIVPVYVDINVGESARNYYTRLAQTINRIKLEREADFRRQRPLFLISICVDSMVQENVLEVISDMTGLDPRIREELIRVIVTTGSGPSLCPQDLTTIVDTGIQEVEYYDFEAGLSYVQEEPISVAQRSERLGLLGKTGYGMFVEINVQGVARPDCEEPAIKRVDLSKPCFQLKSVGYDLENEKNLPTDPPYDHLQHCRETMIRLGITDASRKTTELGKHALLYSFLSPLFAVSVAKFVQKNDGHAGAKALACIAAYVIENCDNLITNRKSAMLIEFFDDDSDLVTVVNALRRVLAEMKPDNNEYCEYIGQCGMSPSYVLELRDLLVSLMGTPMDRIVAQMDTWISTNGDMYTILNSFLTSVWSSDSNWVKQRKASFVRVIDAASETGPTVLYKCEKKLLCEVNDNILQIDNRPGWRGLVAPGTCYIMSIKCNKTAKRNYGFLIHKAPNDNTFGVVSKEVEEILNSPFFVSMFQAYIGKDSAKNDFTAIQLFQKDGNNEFVTHITECNKKTYLNYCPKNQNIHEKVMNGVATITRLLAFVPRSVIVHNNIPETVVEAYSIGSARYESRILLMENLPKAYHINENVINFLVRDPHKLAKTIPAYRFAITGECFMYHFDDGVQNYRYVEYPDTRSTISTVFGEAVSHLVLLVDNQEPVIPGEEPMRWVGEAKTGSVEYNDPTDLISVCQDIMAVNGSVRRTADVFLITYNKNSLTSITDIPDDIRGMCQSPDGKLIGMNFFQLQHHFSRLAMEEKILKREVPIKSFGTRMTNVSSNIESPDQVTREISSNVAGALGVSNDCVQARSLETEGMFMRIEGLALQDSLHPKAAGVSYQPCKYDGVIDGAIRGYKNPLEPTIFHSTCVGFTINHCASQQLTVQEFSDIVTRMVDFYGFYVSCITEYKANAGDDKILGSMFVEICDPLMAISFAEHVKSMIKADPDFQPEITMTMTKTLMQSRLKPIEGGRPPPTVGALEIPRKIPEKAMKAITEIAKDKACSKWKVDKDYGMLIIPVDAEDQLRRIIANETEDICLWTCDGDDDTRVRLPCPLYVYKQDGTYEARGVCQQCMILDLQDKTSMYFNQVTHMIDRDRLLGQIEMPPALTSVYDEPEVPGLDEVWNNVPLGQILLCYISDLRGLAPYVRAWMTAVVEITIKLAVQYFTCCPNHPRFIMKKPPQGVNMACPHCDYMFCRDCVIWHSRNDPCKLEDIPGAKRCPTCKVPVFKFTGCNHITCSCKTHWCYLCRAAFEKDSDCYAHMTAVHGGWFTDA